MYIKANRQECFCAFCKSPRVIYRKRRIDTVNVFASAVAATVAMYAIWQEFDPRVILLFVTCLFIAEAFVQTRWRLNIVCRECGFDPALYMNDQAKASARVKEHLARRKEDPTSLFRTPLNLPKMTRARLETLNKAKEEQEVQQKNKKRGRLLSKQI